MVDVVVLLVRVGAELDGVEDVELRLGSEVSGVGYAGRGEKQFRFTSDIARIAVVALLGHGIDDVG